MSDAASIDLVELTVEQAQAAFASGAITSEALTQAFLGPIAEYNPHCTAIIFPNPDAQAGARAIDRDQAPGSQPAPRAQSRMVAAVAAR